MALSETDVAGIADYTRIALEGDELNQMTDYMNNAIELLDKILDYDLDDVAPTYRPEGNLENVMREDVVNLGDRALDIEAALKNAGSRVDRQFRVPSILGDAEGGDR